MQSRTVARQSSILQISKCVNGGTHVIPALVFGDRPRQALGEVAVGTHRGSFHLSFPFTLCFQQTVDTGVHASAD